MIKLIAKNLFQGESMWLNSSYISEIFESGVESHDYESQNLAIIESIIESQTFIFEIN